MSLFVDKQPQYLLPIVPFACILFAKLLSNKSSINQLSIIFIYLVYIALGLVAFFYIKRTSFFEFDSDIIKNKNLYLNILILIYLFILTIILFINIKIKSNNFFINTLLLNTFLLFIFLNITFNIFFEKRYNLKIASKKIEKLITSYNKIVYIGKYHGQFHYLGKIKEPIETIEGNKVSEWISNNPKGYIIYNHKLKKDLYDITVYFKQAYRGRVLAIWTSEEASKNLDVFTR